MKKDPQRIVDEIRAFLQASDQSYKREYKEAAEDYAEACAEVNRRLAQCAQLLKQGLRAEAIHQADTDPNLLATLAELDFAERAGWLDLVGIYNLPSPPDFDVANAEQLNAAYVEHDPFKNLMKKHRRLALAKAPLRDRLAVLREFARRDPTNPIWSEDVKTYEAVRFKEMQGEAAEAARRSDAVAAEVIERELDGVMWSSPPPTELVRAVRRAAALARHETARRGLPEAEERVLVAFTSQDPAQIRQARKTWLELADVVNLPPGDPARQRVEPAFRWLAEFERGVAARQAIDAATTELEEAIDDPTAPRQELEELWDVLKQLNPDIARPLVHRYQIRLEGFDRTRKRRMRIITIAAAATAAVLVAGATAAYLYSAGIRERSAAVASIRTAIDGRRIDDLEAFLKRLRTQRPGVYSSAEVQALMPEIKRLRDAEVERRTAFAQLLNEAEAAALTGDEPAPLKAAREHARTALEKEKVAKLASEIAGRNRDEAKRRDRDLVPALKELGQTADEIEQSLRKATGADPELTQRIDTTIRQLDEVVPPPGPLSEETSKAVAKFRGRLAAARKQADLLARRGQAADALTRAVGQLPQKIDGYVGAATRLKGEYGQERQVVDIDKLLAQPERATWESALRWSALASDWAASNLSIDSDEARTRIATCRRFQKQYPRCPDATSVERYITYLGVIATRQDTNGGLIGKLKSYLSSASFKNLYMLKCRKFAGDELGGLRYYSQFQPKGVGQIQLLCLLNTDGTTQNRTLESTSIVGALGLSPQSKQTQRIITALDGKFASANWDSMLLDAARGVAEDMEMDPVCKVILVDELLRTAAEGSLSLREVLRPAAEKLAKVTELRRVPWLDPTAKVDDKRAEADTIIKSLPRWDQVTEAAREANLRLLRSVKETPQPIGWISRKALGFCVHLVDADLNARDLELLVAAAEKGKGVWKPVGQVINSEGDLVTQDMALPTEGRLVFARPAVPAAAASKPRSTDQ
jgi:hypothetical protein